MLVGGKVVFVGVKGVLVGLKVLVGGKGVKNSRTSATTLIRAANSSSSG